MLLIERTQMKPIPPYISICLIFYYFSAYNFVMQENRDELFEKFEEMKKQILGD